MQRNANGEEVVGATDLVELMSDPNWPAPEFTASKDLHAELLDKGHPPHLRFRPESELSQAEFDRQNRSSLRIPTAIADKTEEDMLSYLVERNTWGETGEWRIACEYAAFKTAGQIPVLKTMLHFSNVCREKKLWTGIGRGSSVSSYILYLLGIHRVDPIKYGLDFNEFAKKNTEGEISNG